MTEPIRPAISDARREPVLPVTDRLIEGPAHWRTSTRPEPLVRLVVHKGRRLVVLRLEEIDWIEGAGNYARVHVGDESHLHRQTLTDLAARLDPNRFARIHRSTIVRLDAIAQIDRRGPDGTEILLRGGWRLAVSRRYRAALVRKLGGG